MIVNLEHMEIIIAEKSLHITDYWPFKCSNFTFYFIVNDEHGYGYMYGW